MVERAVLISNSSVLKLDCFVIPKTELEANCLENIVPLEEVEKTMILKALKATNYNRVQAAKLLKVERKVVERRMKKYGIHKN
jgi:DNA-binding NtrC family response regulator